jgi:DNA mismatch repair protein MutS
MEVIYDKEKDTLVYYRKLKDGPGNSLYGLEVCKSLSLPTDFLEAANEIRMKYNPGTGSILSLKTSHYNSKKIMNLCELCNTELTTEVHHIQPQRIANECGIIKNSDGSVFHKNNKANLLGLCESCHNKMHSSEYNYLKMKIFKTTSGYILGKN